MSEEITRENLLIAGFPSTGLVGAFAVSYLVRHLHMERVDELDFPNISPTFVIENGKVFGPAQIYKKDHVYAIINWIPLDLISAHDFICAAIEFCKKHGIDKIIIPRGMEIVGRNDIEPKSLGIAVNEKSKSLLGKYGIPTIPNASIFGADAGVISSLRRSDLQSLILYTICRQQFPDPKATAMSINTLARILEVSLDTSEIEKKLETLTNDYLHHIEKAKTTLQARETSASMQLPRIG